MNQGKRALARKLVALSNEYLGGSLSWAEYKKELKKAIAMQREGKL